MSSKVKLGEIWKNVSPQLTTRRTIGNIGAYNGGRAGDIFENRANFEYTQLLQF